MLLNWMLEKTLEGPLNCKEIQPVHPKGDQSWVFTGRTDFEGTTVLWQPDAKSWLIKKDPDAGKDWGQEEKGTTEDEMVGWHHWLDEYGFGWTPGVGDKQGGLVCCGSWGHKESDTTKRMNSTELFPKSQYHWKLGQGNRVTRVSIWTRKGCLRNRMTWPEKNLSTFPNKVRKKAKTPGLSDKLVKTGIYIDC